MPRLRTHKFAVQTTGLSHEDAARLHYLLACAADAFTKDKGGAYETAGNVPLTVLRRLFPGGDWHRANRKDRLDLID